MVSSFLKKIIPASILYWHHVKEILRKPRNQTQHSSPNFTLIYWLCFSAGGAIAYTHLKSWFLFKSLNPNEQRIASKLRAVVGKNHITIYPFIAGMRVGCGRAVAYIEPGTLQEACEAIHIITQARGIIIPQGANTSLTGGAVPRDGVDRPQFVVNFQRLQNIKMLNDGSHRVLCLAGTGLWSLEEFLKQKNREPHSVLGSQWLNPTVAAGVALGSGGTQLRQGPSYTEKSLYILINEKGCPKLINHLGIRAPSQDKLFELLQSHGNLPADVIDTQDQRKASVDDYKNKVITHDGALRFNANLNVPSSIANTEGKVIILATIHDTFPLPHKRQTVWLASSRWEPIAQLRKEYIRGGKKEDLPARCEYINRSTLEILEQQGPALVNMIDLVGMKHLGKFYKFKNSLERYRVISPFFLMVNFFLKSFNPQLFPEALQVISAQPHHVLLELVGSTDEQFLKNQARLQNFLSRYHLQAVFCDEPTASKVWKIRSVSAAAISAHCKGNNLIFASKDYALRNDDYHELTLSLPYDLETVQCVYAHYGDQTIHNDILLRKGKNDQVIEHLSKSIMQAIQNRGGFLPAEHGHGTTYPASISVQDKARSLDPTNTCAAGNFGTSRSFQYKD